MEKLQKLVDKVNKIFKENSCGFRAEPILIIPNSASIEINGDWKHDHAYADYVMEENGFKLISERIVEDTECDWYTSVHYYEMK